ncbi:tripartite tricarboxylate transporter substrate binding protein [Acidovorax sp. JHL-9]|uniref:Bug family tripartite tricarboxylate transporter substrate binding protein n=1 Tax=Acidovorax sp. JHL-9 TaxID=1276756 RepID=UPI000413F037|nr:tripartite tricarboxylate transporter substrate-binding protein [Acidovorax sp. JHL-9]
MKLTRILSVTALALATQLAQAQAWPTKSMTWIVPFAAGGPTDAMARDIADKVGKQIGQPVIIENAAGAGGTIGAAKAAKASPDGYTFLVGHMGYMGAGPALYKKLAYDPVKDFETVFRFPDTPLVLLVGKNSPHKTAGELIAAAKAKPGVVNFGNAGVGSTSHLIAALFAAKAGIDVTQVAYKGAAPAINDLIGGQVDAMFDQSNTALPQVQGNRLNAIGLTSLTPMPQQYPGVAPLAEKTLAGFEAATWYGLYAPKGTPKDVVQKMHQAYIKALADKSWTTRMAGQGIHLLPEAQYAPDAFAKHTAAEVERWRKVVTDAKIQLD